MRIRIIIAAAVLLVIPVRVRAQATVTQTPTTQAAPTAPEPTPRFGVGFIDFGGRGTWTVGDAARYERYRDLSDGVFLETALLRLNRGDWAYDFSGEHVGYRDQRYVATATRQGRFQGYFMWDQIPMLLSRTTQTFFQGDVGHNDGVLKIEDAIQAAGQSNANNIPLLFVPPNTQQFELGTIRHIAETGFDFLPRGDINIHGLFRNTDRQGGIAYGGSFGHSQLVETVAPIDHTTRDVDASMEYTHGRYLFRGGYTGSWFANNHTDLTFDNPWRLVDTSSASSRGRSSLPPSSSFVGVNGLASMRLPGRSRATAYVSTSMLQDAGKLLMPQTANSITTGITALPRQTVEGAARMLTANLTFTSRPSTHLDFSARYRSYDYDNQTPVFTTFQRVSYDNAVSTTTTPFESEPFGVIRRTFDADARYLPMMGTAIGVGYSYQNEERSHRIYRALTDNTVRLTFDTVGNQLFSLRTRYEHTERRGDGLDEEVLVAAGEQTGMRHMDQAPRDRDRVTLVGTITPVNNLAVNASVAAGNDDYLESVFGLRDNNHRVYSVGFDATPRDNMVFSMSYSREHYMALARSRQANPATPTGCVPVYPAPAGKVTCQFDDPARNWAADTDDLVHSFILNADFPNLWNRIDIRIAYDLNKSTSTYHYTAGSVPDRTLPEETPPIPTTLPDPVQLPDVFSNLNRGEFDFVYNFNKRVGLGFSYWYEKFDVQDWALDAEAIGSQAKSNAVLLGYMYTPYTAQTGWVRLLVRW